MHGSQRSRGRVALFVCGLAGMPSCARHTPPDETPRVASHPEPTAAPAIAPVEAQPPAEAPPLKSELETWLLAHLPQGGRVDRQADSSLRVVHVAREGDTVSSIARGYIDLTTAYTEQELADAIAAANHVAALARVPAGRELAIPHLVTAVPPPPASSRLGWPEDAALSGIYAHMGMIGVPYFPHVLDGLAANGMNAIVVDAKTYPGWLTYSSSIPLAVDTKASSHAVLPSLERLVRVAHARGIRVIWRVSCFHDEWMASHRPDLGIRGVHDWLNPADPKVQDYVLAIVDEVLPTGADEIQLDYVRYPTEGIAHADFALGKRTTTEVIAEFVRRVHDHTSAAGVPLSLDLFGVVAWQRPEDVKATGQDLTKLAPIVEAISPMVYPSHFSAGTMGYSAPGEHPDVVGFGTKQAVEVVRQAGAKTVVRPWIQAFSWRAPDYDQQYVSREIDSARTSAGVGWLAWNAGGYYREVFAAAPRKAAAKVAQEAAKTPGRQEND